MRVVAEAMESPVAGDDGESDEDEGDDQGPAWRAAISRRMASGARAAAVAVADAVGAAAGRKTVSPDRSRTNSGRHRRRKPPTAVADFDGGSDEPAPTLIQPEPASQPTHHEPAPTAYIAIRAGRQRTYCARG